ncbi:MAG TPA: trypsin-like serine protease [Gaiellaceae bacterium]
MRRPRPLLALFVLLFAFATAVVPAGAITNGQPDGTAHPNVGVMVVDFGAGPQRLCSGELIAPTRFLTAGHCTSFLVNNPTLLGVTFDSTFNPSTSTVIPAVSVSVDPLFGKGHGDFHDLGVITLASPVAASPVVLPTAGLLDRLGAQGGLKGQEFTIVGYGATGYAFGGGPPTPVDFFPAVRRIATSPFKALEQNVLRLQGNTTVTGEGGTCGGDSGSASYLNVGGTDVAVAIVSPPVDRRCVGNDANYRLDTPSARAFLGRFVTLP